ncbi:MAG: NAD(P) transhydrogenase subunit alpha [Planctomycetota bacterium]
MTLLLMLFVFMLAIAVGNELISKVPPTLHTPLMSGANAVSGITIVGALMCSQYTDGIASQILGVLAIALATINVVGGFLVTDRMLSMFGSKKKKEKK